MTRLTVGLARSEKRVLAVGEKTVRNGARFPFFLRTPIGACGRLGGLDEQPEAIAGIVQAGEKIAVGCGFLREGFPDAFVPSVAIPEAAVLLPAGGDFIGDEGAGEDHGSGVDWVVGTGARQKSEAQRSRTLSLAEESLAFAQDRRLISSES